MLLSACAAANNQYFIIMTRFIVRSRLFWKTLWDKHSFSNFLLLGSFFFLSKVSYSHGCCLTIVFMSVQPSVSSFLPQPFFEGQRGRNIHFQLKGKSPAFRDASVCLCCIQKRKLCISAAWVQSDLFIRLTAHLKFLSWSCLMTFKRDINKVKTGTCESPVAVHHLQLQLCFDFCTFSPTRILAFWPLQVLDVYMESKCQSKQLSLQQLSE